MTPEALLQFEHEHPGHKPGKEEEIRRRFGVSPARYYQRLNRVAKSLEGIRADPITARMVRDKVPDKVH